MDINDKLKKRNLNDDNVAKGEVCNWAASGSRTNHFLCDIWRKILRRVAVF
jgi:hypothetical protein